MRTAPPETLCQIAGDRDWQTGQPTPGLAEQDYGVRGTDLGFSFLHQGRLFFLFGDTWPRPGLNRDVNSDTIGSVLPTAPGIPSETRSDLCQHFKFVTESPSGYLQVRLDGSTLGARDVPLSGFSSGDAMYVFFLHPTGGEGDLRAYRATLGVSRDLGRHFATVVSELPDFFQEVAPVVVDSQGLGRSGLPWVPQQIVLFFAKTLYEGLPYLAAAPLRTIENPITWLYFSGTSADGTPQWSTSPHAKAIVCLGSVIGTSISELSVAWEPYLKRWLMLFETDGGSPPGIRMESATAPWGPWTATSEVVLDSNTLGCQSIYWPEGRNGQRCDSLDATSQLPWLQHQRGRAYGAYLIPGYDEWDPVLNTAHVYFTMSTFNPYTPLILRVGLQLQSRFVPRGG